MEESGLDQPTPQTDNAYCTTRWYNLTVLDLTVLLTLTVLTLGETTALFMVHDVQILAILHSRSAGFEGGTLLCFQTCV